MSEVKFNEKEMELFLLGVQEDNKRITELEAENKRLREALEVEEVRANDFAEEIRHLSERTSELLTQNALMREALKEITEYHNSTNGVIWIAKKALEKQ